MLVSVLSSKTGILNLATVVYILLLTIKYG